MPILIQELRAIVLIIALKHLISGTIILFDSLAINVATTAYLLQTLTFFGLDGEGYIFVGILLVLSGALALIALWIYDDRRNYRTIVLLVLPQQFIVIFQFISISETILMGRYPDGYIPAGNPHLFIAVDHIGSWLLAISHGIWVIWAILRIKKHG